MKNKLINILIFLVLFCSVSNQSVAEYAPSTPQITINNDTVSGTFATMTKLLFTPTYNSFNDYVIATVSEPFQKIDSRIGDFIPDGAIIGEGNDKVYYGSFDFNNSPWYFKTLTGSQIVQFTDSDPLIDFAPIPITLTASKIPLISTLSAGGTAVGTCASVLCKFSLKWGAPISFGVSTTAIFLFNTFVDPPMNVVVEDLGLSIYTPPVAVSTNPSVVTNLSASNQSVMSFTPATTQAYNIVEGNNNLNIGSFSISSETEYGTTATQNFKITFINPDDSTDYDSLTSSFAVTVICSSDADCDDQNSCTDDYCAGGLCYNLDNGTCGGDGGGSVCSSDADCDDQNLYTDDYCVDGLCYNLDNGGGSICSSDADCDDQNSCTDDACVDGLCYNLPNGACGGGGGGEIVPEPISSILFVTGGMLLAGRRYLKSARERKRRSKIRG